VAPSRSLLPPRYDVDAVAAIFNTALRDLAGRMDAGY
jgi:hypothetical protein